MKKSLLFLAVFNIAAFSNIKVNATSLNELFLSEEVKVTFDNNTVQYNGSNISNGSVNDQDYICEVNTCFIDMNILPNLGNTRNNNAKYILSGIKGSDNISLQSQNSNVLTSLMFVGDNRDFTGTLYLHPAINELFFLTQESVINNINIPKLKDSNKKKMITIGLPDNSSYYKNVKIPSNLSVKFVSLRDPNLFDNNLKKYMLINKLHVLKNSRFVVNNFPLILGKQVSDIKTNLNITSSNYKTNPLTTIINCIATARYDESIGDSIFEYILSCNKCSTVINPLVCKYCDTSLSELLSHTGAVNQDNKQYFLNKEYVLHKLLKSGNTKCSNLSCKYNFDKSKINMELQSELAITEEDIVNETTNKFIIQNKYSCSACGTDLESGIIKSDPIDIVYQPLKDVKQNITNFIDVLENPDKYTVPEFFKLFTTLYYIQLPLLSDKITDNAKPSNDITFDTTVSALQRKANFIYNDIVKLVFNNIKPCFDTVKPIIEEVSDVFNWDGNSTTKQNFYDFINNIQLDNMESAIKFFSDFNNTIVKNLSISSTAPAGSFSECWNNYLNDSKNTYAEQIIQKGIPGPVFYKTINIMSNIMQYYYQFNNETSIISYDESTYNALKDLLENKAAQLNLPAFYTNEYGSSILYIVYNMNASSLANKTASLTSIENTFKSANETFLANIIGTKCKVCNAKFISE